MRIGKYYNNDRGKCYQGAIIKIQEPSIKKILNTNMFAEAKYFRLLPTAFGNIKILTNFMGK